MAQNKATSNDNLVSILDCLNESLSEVESCNSDNETDSNQESECKIGISDSE